MDRAQTHAESGLYAQAMAGYVVWLIRNWDRLAAEAPQRIEQARQAGRDIFGEDRLADLYAPLVVAGWGVTLSSSSCDSFARSVMRLSSRE